MSELQNFRNEIKELLQHVLKEFKKEGALKVVWGATGQVISILESAGPLYSRIIRTLRNKALAAKKLLSDEEIERILNEFVIQLAYQKPATVNRTIDRAIEGLFKKVKEMPVHRQLFLIPVENADVRTELAVGDTVLVRLSEAIIQKIEKENNVSLRTPYATVEKTVEALTRDNQTLSFIRVTADASDSKKAKELAIQKADTLLNVLRLFNPDAPCVVRGEGYAPVLRTTIGANLSFRIPNSIVESESVNSVTNKLVVNDELLQKMRDSGLDILNEIMGKNKDELTDLQTRILTAIFWIGNAAKDRFRTDKFVKYTIALETLLLTGERNKKETIARRFISIAYKNNKPSEKSEALANMAALYDIRNRIVHDGLDYVEADDLNQLESWTRSLTLILLRYAKKYENISQLLKTEFAEDRSLRLHKP
jgi:hypothetical protein